MCHWLTLAVPDAAALAPLRPLGELDTAEFPVLPDPYRHLQRFLLTDGQCSCALFGRERLPQLEQALLAIAYAQPVVLAHRCFGDPPRGGSRLAPLQPHDCAAFLAAKPTGQGGWVRLEPQFAPGAPLPARIGGAVPFAFAFLERCQPDGAVVAVLGDIEHVPGVTAMRCDAHWQVLQSEWFADDGEAHAAMVDLHWQPVDRACR